MSDRNVFQKLLDVQLELKAPKGQWNDFSKYNYRSAEDILEAVKPLLKRHGLLQFISDEVITIGERCYVKATVTVVDVDKPSDRITVTGNAREEETKKGMDGSQITGAASSYARKYALNGMYNIDDSKDSDTSNNGEDKADKLIKALGNTGDDKAIAEIYALGERKGYGKEQLQEKCEKAFRMKIESLNKNTLAKFKEALEKQPELPFNQGV